MTPPVPTQQVNARTILAPAQAWGGRQTIETPELYPVFPYHLCGIGLANRALGVDSFEEIPVKRGYFKPFPLGGPTLTDSFSGWQQTPMIAALLGLTDRAQSA